MKHCKKVVLLWIVIMVGLTLSCRKEAAKEVLKDAGKIEVSQPENLPEDIVSAKSRIEYGGEKYTFKEVALIPWGDDDSLLGMDISDIARYANGHEDEDNRIFIVYTWDIGLDGKIYISDMLKKRVSVYDSNGHYLRSIGILPLDSDKITVKTTSGKEKVIYANHSGKYDPLQNVTIPFSYKTYYDEPSDVAVDGNGDIYVISSLSAKYLMKFSPEGKLLEIIDQFGEYGSENMKMGVGQLFSDANGNILVDISLKHKQFWVIYNSEGELIDTNYAFRDAQDNTYEMIMDYWPECLIAIKNPKDKTIDTFAIYNRNGSIARVSSFSGVDADGNIYLNAFNFKYDKKGDLLARPGIPWSSRASSTRTFKYPLEMSANSPKVMGNGDIYNAYVCDQGFVVIKNELQQETKGQILKPTEKSKEQLFGEKRNVPF